MATIKELTEMMILADQDGRNDDVDVLSSEIERMQDYQSAVQAQENEIRRMRGEPIDHYSQQLEDTNFLENLAIGAGGGLTGMYLGAKQALGLDDPGEIAEHEQSMAPVRETTGGMIGDVGGKIAAAAPLALVPGANTLAGAALVGGGLGAMEPVGEDESRLANVGLGVAGGAVGQKTGDILGKFMRNRAALKTAETTNQRVSNEVRDETLNIAKEQGYKIPPSYANAGTGRRLAEGLSGKYKTNQYAGIENQVKTDMLARKAVDMPDTMPMDADSLQTLRNQAYNATYTPVRSAGPIRVDDDYIEAMEGVVKEYNSAAKSFPGATGDEVAKVVDNLLVDEFDSGHAIDMVKILRGKAKAAYRQGEGGIGRANNQAAKAIEDQIERHLSNAGEDGKVLLDTFRKGRQYIAKTHSIEDALDSGHVSAVKLGQQLSNGKPLSGELKEVARVGRDFRDVAGVPKSGHANPFTIMDFGFATAGGMLDPTLVGLPVARYAARRGILSDIAQSGMKPKYSSNLTARALGGLFDDDITRQLMTAGGAQGLLGAVE